MAKKRIPEEKMEQSEGLAPIINCMFIMLMYFIIAGQIKTEEKYLGLLIPGGGTPTAGIPVELVLAINEVGQVFCNEQPLDTPADRELPTVRGKIKQCLDLFGEKTAGYYSSSTKSTAAKNCGRPQCLCRSRCKKPVI